MQLCHKFNTVFDHRREKYVRMYERFIEELKLYSRAIRVLSKGYLPISTATPIQTGKDFE